MSVSPFVLVVIVAVVICLLFLVQAGIVMATTIYNRRRDRRQTAARERVREGLFERLEEPQTDWSTWVDSLSRFEQRQLANVIEGYLRTIRGNGREPFLAVARALKMGEQATERLDHPETISRLQALARLTVLDYPIDEQRILQTSLDDRRTRVAAARLFYERSDDVPGHRTLATGLLVWTGREPLDVWGLETLHALNADDPSPLYSLGYWGLYGWTPAFVMQICSVLQDCRLPHAPSSHEWFFRLFDHENPGIRAAAVQAVTRAGHRTDIRSRVPFQPLVTDTDSGVRRTTYRLLAQWGDERSKGLLEWAVVDENDERAQLLATRVLATLESNPDEEQPGWPDDAWEWVRAERTVLGDEYRKPEGVLA